MRNIPYDLHSGLNLPREVQLQRMLRVMENELTALQRHTIGLYYFEELSISQIARRRGVHPSTVLRTLRRAEARLQRCLNY